MALNTNTFNTIQNPRKQESIVTNPEVVDITATDAQAHVTTTISTHRTGPRAEPPTNSQTQVNNLGGISQTRQIAAVLKFPTPVPLSINYPKNWGTQDFSLMTQFLAESYGIVMDGQGSFGSDAAAVFRSAKSKAGEAIRRKIQNMTGQTHSGGFLNMNQTELLFQGVDFREINLSHTFAPRSEQELIDSLKLITLYKKYSAPKKSGAYRLSYPALFELDFSLVDGGSIFKTKPVACTNVSVNYTPNELWNTFNQGHPTMFTVDLSFKEVELLMQDDFDENDPFNSH